MSAIAIASAILGLPPLGIVYVVNQGPLGQAVLTGILVLSTGAAAVTTQSRGDSLSEILPWLRSPLDSSTITLASGIIGVLIDVLVDGDRARRRPLSSPLSLSSRLASYAIMGTSAIALGWSLARLSGPKFSSSPRTERVCVTTAFVASLCQFLASIGLWQGFVHRGGALDAEKTLIVAGLGKEAVEVEDMAEPSDRSGYGSVYGSTSTTTSPSVADPLLLHAPSREMESGELLYKRLVVRGHRVLIVEGGGPDAESGRMPLTVVCLHGYGSGTAFWSYVAKELAPRFERVVAVDWLGSAMSERPSSFPGSSIFAPRNEETALLAERWLIDSMQGCLCDLFGNEQPELVVMAHSLGGFVTGGWFLDSILPAADRAVAAEGAYSSPHVSAISSSSDDKTKGGGEEGEGEGGGEEEVREEEEVEGRRLQRTLTLRAPQVPQSRVEKLLRSIRAVVLVSPVGLPDFNGIPQRFQAPIFRLIASLWLWDVTPMSVLRFVGPLGPWLARLAAKNRFSRLSEGSPKIPTDAAGDYISIPSIIQPACGEITLGRLLRPGAFAYRPLARRMVEQFAARRTRSHHTPALGFVYGGSKDWMDSDAALPVLEMARRVGIHATCVIEENGGHQVALERPKTVAQAVIATAEAALATTRS